MPRFVRGVLGSGGVWVLRLAMTLGMSFLLGHLLGPTEYGRYAFFLATVTLFAPLCSLGYDMLAAREFASARAGGNEAEEAALARALPAAVWKNAAVVMLVFLPATMVYNAWRHQPWGMIVVLEAIGVVLTAQLRLVQGSLRGLSRVSQGQLFQLILPPLLNLALFGAALILLRPSADLAIVTLVVGLAIAYPLGARAVRRVASALDVAATVESRKVWARSAMVLGVTQIMFVANEQVPVVVTGLLGSSTEVGLLDMARRFALFASIALNVIALPLGPILAEMYRKGDMEAFRRVSLQTTYVGVGISISITLAYLACGRWLLHSIDPQFAAAYWAMLVMCLGYVINTMTGPVPLALTMTGFERDAVKGIVGGIVVNLAACMFLVPIIGHMGAAIGSVLGQFVWNSILAVLVRRRLGMTLDILALFERPRKAAT
jgi:O-antigen/teichoic acid export membrane protein